MKGLFIIIKKEFWEWRYSLKKIAILGVVFLFPIIAYNSEGSIFVAASSVGGVLIILTAVGGITQITAESILAEKKNKTLEILVSTRLSTISIILGKIIPGMIVGLILSVIMFLIFLMLNIALVSSLSIPLIVNFLLFVFLSGFIVFIITLLIPDEKIFSITSIFILIAILGLLKALTIFHLPLTSIVTIPVLITLNILTSIIAKKLMIKTKLYLKI